MKRIVAIVLAMLVLAGVGVMVRGGDNDASNEGNLPQETPADANAERATPSAVTTADRPEAGPAAPSSSDAETPDDASAPPTLAERFPALDAAARAGDAHAACTLAAELERCKIADGLKRFENESSRAEQLALQSLDEDQLQEQIDGIAGRTHVLDRATAHCAGIPEEVRRSASAYVAMAAAAGHVPSQIRMLAGTGLAPVELLRDATPLATYRANAPIWFRNALASGDLTLLQLIVHTTRWGQDMPLSDYLPAEWKDPGMVSALIDQLDPAQRESAFPPGSLPQTGTAPTDAQRQAAADMYARHFADSPPLPGIERGHTGSSAERIENMLNNPRTRCDEGMP